MLQAMAAAAPALTRLHTSARSATARRHGLYGDAVLAILPALVGAIAACTQAPAAATARQQRLFPGAGLVASGADAVPADGAAVDAASDLARVGDAKLDATVDANGAGTDATAGAPCDPGTLRCRQGVREVCGDAGWVPDPCAKPTPLCADGKCLACLPGSRSCAAPATGSSASQTVLQCAAAGLESTAVETCSGGACVDGACLPCAPGLHRCHAGAREVCDAAGKGWQPAPCAKSAPTCTAGKCALCAPGAMLCLPAEPGEPASLVVALCDKAGADVELVQTCKPPEACFGGACRICLPGSMRCGATGVRETCAATGKAWQATPCPTALPACLAGGCLACAPLATFCGAAGGDGSPSTKVLKCDAAGAQGALVEVCKDGLVCTAGKCGVCAAGAGACLGTAALACQPDGGGWATVADCAAKNVACVDGQCACMPAQSSCAAPAAGAMASMAALCAADGKSATLTATCKAGDACMAGLCGGCLPLAKRCQDGKALQCKADGSGWQVSANCTQQGHVCAAGACLDPCDSKVTNPTHLGCEFFAVDLDNAAPKPGQPGPDAAAAAFALLLTNPDTTQAATITISPTGDAKAPGTKVVTATVPAGGQASVVLPPTAWGVPPLQADGSGLSTASWKVTSDRPVAVAQWNPLDPTTASSGASLLRPTNALGLAYRVVTRAATSSQHQAFAVIVATRSGSTVVTVTPKATIAAGAGIGTIPPGSAVPFALSQGQVLALASTVGGGDLTGTRIVADQPVAVFAGAEAVHAPDTSVCAPSNTPGTAGACVGTGQPCFGAGDCPQLCCGDHIEEQLPPTTAWGTVHPVAKLPPRFGPALDPAYVRIVADADHTTVAVLPAQATPVTLQAGGWFEFAVTADVVIVASKPVLVARFLTTGQFAATAAAQAAGGANAPTPLGDPAMGIVTPTARHVAAARFSVPAGYTAVHVVFAVPPQTSVLLDGSAVALEPLKGDGWRSARIALGSGVHQFTSDQPVGADLVGWTATTGFLVPVGWGAP